MLGDLEQRDDGRWRLRFVRTLHHPREKVWRAITEPEHLAAWFPTTIDGERAAGARLGFSFPDGEAPAFDGEMLVFEPPTAMELRWGTDILRLEVAPTADGTVLTLLYTLEDRGKGARDGAGWHTCLDALDASLGGAADAREALSRWAAVHRGYVERFGPEAATIGPPAGFE